MPEQYWGALMDWKWERRSVAMMGSVQVALLVENKVFLTVS